MYSPINKESEHQLEENRVKQLNIPYGQGKQFPLLYSENLTLTPEQTTLFIANQVSSKLSQTNKIGLRLLELGVGSGVFSSALILNSDPGKFSHVQAVDIDYPALAVAEINIGRAIKTFCPDQTELALTRSDWFNELHLGRYDVIYAAPPYRTKPLNPSSDYILNPNHAIYSPTYFCHYESIAQSLLDYINPGAMVVLRTPRAADKVQHIRGILSNHVNMNALTYSEAEFEKGKYILLMFN